MNKDKVKSQVSFENYLDYFIKSDYFQLEIKKIREEFSLNANGYPAEDLGKWEMTDFMQYFPSQIAIRKKELLKPINLAVARIKFPARRSWVISHIFKLYLFHNKNYYNLFENLFASNNNLCDLVVQYNDVREYEGVDSELYLEKRIKETEAYPLAIQFHQNVSQRFLVDFIKKNWKVIEYYQSDILKGDSSRTSKVGKIRTGNKEIKERNAFICENPSLPIKEIRKSLAKKKIFLDDGHISKVRSLGRKRRKEV